MSLVDPVLREVIVDLERGLRERGVPFGIIGALVPQLLLADRPPLLTEDADVVVVVETMPEFEELKIGLEPYGFQRTPVVHRLRHRSGRPVDMLPYSQALAPDDRLTFGVDRVMNMTGFRHVVPNAIRTTIDGELVVPVAPLPLYTLLKLIAFGERRKAKDLGGVLHCLQHYAEDDDRRYGGELDVPFECSTAYLLGYDGRPLLDAVVGESVRRVLDSMDGPHAPGVQTALSFGHGPWADEDRQARTFELFQWYRRGTGL